MRICVIGAGAIGGLLAIKLAQAGHIVSVVARGANLLAIQNNIREYKAIIIVAVSPPTSDKDHAPCNVHSEVTGGPIPFIGTDWARVIYRNCLNRMLEEECSKFGYIFFNPYGPYTREDGTLKYELSDKCIHVWENAHIINEFQKLITSIRQA